MTEALHRARCVVHPTREAASQCTSCQRFYCRECVTRHEGRLQCARCLALAAEQAGEAASRGWWVAARVSVQVVGGVLAAWLFFLTVGELLLAIPKGPDEIEETAVEVAE